MEIVEIDLQTGRHEVILVAPCPAADTHYNYPFFYPAINGALATVSISSTRRDDTHSILEWKAQSCFLLVGVEARGCSISRNLD
jgi:hypothetical protein